MANSKPVGVAYADPALVAGTTIDSATVTNTTLDSTNTINAAIGGTTPAAGSFTNETQNGTLTRYAQTLAAAGATQGTAGAITKSVVVVTVTASAQGVKLPTAATGLEYRVHVPGTVGVTVYPATGDKIDASSTNGGVVLAAGKANIYYARNTSQWLTLKELDVSVVEFDIRVPVADAGLVSNVASSLSRGLPEVGYSLPRSDRLAIVANGPSALQAPLDGPTLAVNGALGLFGEGPTWWAGCDPQEHLADFLTDPPLETVYLVASKCHPAVFEALKHRTVLVWHIDDPSTWEQVKDRDPVMCGVSITVCAFELMARFGFRRFTTWGWDGCYLDGRDHARPQTHVGLNIENDVGGRLFATTTSWALEAQDAWNKLAMLDIDIRGGGMIGEIFRYMKAVE